MSETKTVLSEWEAELVVDRKQLVADSVAAIVLRDPDGAELPAWTPGAHVDLVLDPALTRQYSLCGDPADRSYWRVGVLRDPASRGGSAFVHDRLAPGATVRVRGPRNHFPLVRSSRYRFIAGGIGITPLLPMIADAEASGADWTLTYGGRQRASMAFLDELHAYGDRVRVCPEDEQGRLDLAAALAEPADDTLVYCCGPEGLLAAVETGCSVWPVDSLRVERFAAKPPGDEAVAAGAFEVVLARSGLTLEVPADRSLLEVLEDEGVAVLGSCYEGICGTCETVVLEGAPDHRDSVLSDSERDSGDLMMVCVSRCHGPRLTLDI